MKRSSTALVAGFRNRNGPARGLVLRGAARPPEGGFAEGANSPVGKAIVSPIAHRDRAGPHFAMRLATFQSHLSATRRLGTERAVSRSFLSSNCRFARLAMLYTAPIAVPGAPHVVVIGNEKGGSGKTTIAMHLAVALLKQGQRVGTIDLDSNQKALTRYIENRRIWANHRRIKLEIPLHRYVRRAEGAKLD
jgi:Mrp family chromosome partitioning ATPase